MSDLSFAHFETLQLHAGPTYVALIFTCQGKPLTQRTVQERSQFIPQRLMLFAITRTPFACNLASHTRLINSMAIEETGYAYSRISNPTVDVFEKVACIRTQLT